MSEGLVHYKKIANFINSKKNVRAKGCVYRLEVGFPVFSHQGQTEIFGTLVSLNDCETLWKVLDEFHGYSPKTPEKSLHQRVEIEVTCDDGETHKAFVYAINPNKLPKSASLIEDGDWLRSIKEKEPLTQFLTTSQVNYIQKLGKSTGRDIVPINLDLYRELMSKGLIVDKGRRLALTHLGQEVFRYLD